MNTFELDNIEMLPSIIQNVINDYSCHHISQINEINMNKKIITNLNNSKNLVIDIFNEKNQDIFFFIISFKKTLLIIQSLFSENNSLISSLIKTLSIINPNLSFCFLPNTNKIIKNIDLNQILHTDYDSTFSEEIYNFCQSINIDCISNSKIKKLYQNVLPSIAGYLIKQSYTKVKEKHDYDTINYYQNIDQNTIVNNLIKENDYIFLRNLNSGSSFEVSLIYLIEQEEIFAIKKSYYNEIELIDQEIKNYKKINYPFLSKLYGIVEIQNTKYQIIQYINGQSLKNIKKFSFTEEEKITIIFEIMIIINYLHKNKFVYRNLNPNNVIIDQDKNAYIIDFCRMIEITDIETDNKIQTNNFSSFFEAPEAEFSYKSDVFALGQMIYYIITEKYPHNGVCKEMMKNSYDSQIREIYKMCIKKNPNQRPSIKEIMLIFYNLFSSKIKKSMILNDQEVKQIHSCIKKDVMWNEKNIYFNIGINYIEGKYLIKDINKAIYYFKIAADQNIPDAQYNLGAIYYEGPSNIRDIDKAIHYFSLAADNKFILAQFYLGVLYLLSNHIEKDVNKAIHYFTLAANQNHAPSQFNLGVIYIDKKYSFCDIKKSIHYFTLAANQNYLKAQYYLADIYYEGKFINRDINKAIFYYSLATNQNDQNAQFVLGLIYYDKLYIAQDINKSIHYFTLAAAQNNIEAQFMLGLIYGDDQYSIFDINRAIHYYTLAANKNHVKAQFNLGNLYISGKNIPRDINRSIFYYKLAANQNYASAQFNLGVIYWNGIHIERNINKSINYYSLASKQNYLKAQFNLGLIYYNNKFINRDIDKAIYYLYLASNQNYAKAQYFIGFIFYTGEYITRDINKAIHYFSLASNLNNKHAQFLLGFIYHTGQYVKQDIKKAIYYYKLAINQNHPNAQFFLGLIYMQRNSAFFDIEKAIHYISLAADQYLPQAQTYLGNIYIKGQYVKQDINKAIYYYSLAKKKNDSYALYNLGIIYTTNNLIERNMIKGIDFFIQSAKNKNVDAHFIVGYFYHEGKYVERDMEKSINHYKEASSFNNQYAKNNLGIIYKNGIEGIILKNIGFAIEYFDEAITRFNDEVSMYNLAHICIYEDKTDEKIDQSIDLLIKSANKNFIQSQTLLCIALIKRYGFNLEIIKSELQKRMNITEDLSKKIHQMIINLKLTNEQNFIELYNYYKKIDFLYDFLKNPICTQNISIQKQQIDLKNKNAKNITKDFYEGFGIE